MRSDSQQTRVLVADAQARLMLHAAMMYVQEGSRIGWGEESFGWTDVRDGSLGPRPPRLSGGSADIPPPAWWNYGSTYAPSPDDSQLPMPKSSRRWPCPGSTVRCPMAVPVQPPYATQLRYAYNPVYFPPSAPRYGEVGWEAPWINAPTGVDPIQRTAETGGAPLPTARYWPIAWADAIFDPTRGATAALDPQPVADVWRDPAYVGAAGQTPDFISGAIQQGVVGGDWIHFVEDGSSSTEVQLQVRPGSENLSWFRVYREELGDHDGDGVPAYDRVVMYDRKNPALKNWNVFVIAAGVGGTRGYRFWDASDLAAWESTNRYAGGTVSAGQEFAVDSHLFATQADFNSARAATRILWFRVEWSALEGGGFIPEKYSWSGMRIYPRYDPWARGTTPDPYPVMLPGPYPGWQARQNLILNEVNSDLILGVSDGGYADKLRYSAPKTFGGNFRWVQRLDHEPPNW
jgi:hypothetical protein